MNQIPTIRSVMTAFPYTVELNESLLRARALMVEHAIRHLPVTADGKLVGILSDRDLKRALDPEMGLPPKVELQVADVYLPDAYVVEGIAPLDEVLAHMAEGHLGSALVTKNDRLVGILTATDACRLFAEHLRSAHRQPTGSDAA